MAIYKICIRRRRSRVAHSRCQALPTPSPPLLHRAPVVRTTVHPRPPYLLARRTTSLQRLRGARASFRRGRRRLRATDRTRTRIPRLGGFADHRMRSSFSALMYARGLRSRAQLQKTTRPRPAVRQLYYGTACPMRKKRRGQHGPRRPKRSISCNTQTTNIRPESPTRLGRGNGGRGQPS